MTLLQIETLHQQLKVQYQMELERISDVAMQRQLETSDYQSILSIQQQLFNLELLSTIKEKIKFHLLQPCIGIQEIHQETCGKMIHVNEEQVFLMKDVSVINSSPQFYCICPYCNSITVLDPTLFSTELYRYIQMDFNRPQYHYVDFSIDEVLESHASYLKKS